MGNYSDHKQEPDLIKNYEILKNTGILDYIEQIKIDNKSLESLINEAYELFRKESVDELIDSVINFLSDKFIPSNLVFILNEGILFNKIKVISFKNLKIQKSSISIDSLEYFEKFFNKYSGTTHFSIFEKEFSNNPDIHKFKLFHPEIIVPILGISGLYGIILFGPKILGEEYYNSEIAYIDRLMKFTSIGIQNNIHYDHSVKDSKTGLYNHNFFVSRLNEELSRSKRKNRSLSVIIMDIDRFKIFNDTYGHLAGDHILLLISDILKKTVREEDILSRFGGEEFIVLLPDSDKTVAWNAAERLRKEIEQFKTEYNGNELKVTISLGIAEYSGAEIISSHDILKNADRALYQSKENGRNRTTIFNPAVK